MSSNALVGDYHENNYSKDQADQTCPQCRNSCHSNGGKKEKPSTTSRGGSTLSLLLEGTLIPDNDGNIVGGFHYSDTEEFLIKVGPEITQVVLPDDLTFIGTLDNQMEFYDWLRDGPAEYRWGIDGYTLCVEIDIPAHGTTFRLEGGDCWWAGFETTDTRVMRKYPLTV